MDLTKKALKIKIPDQRLLAVRVADKLRNLILSGQLKPRDKLTETDLARGMGVSRFPIRSAFHILELEGLVSIVPRKGVFVTEISPDEIKEIYEIRSMIEGYAAKLVAQNITKREISELESILKKTKTCIEKEDSTGIMSANSEFHTKMVENSRNGKLLSIYENLVVSIKRHQSYSLSFPWSASISLQEHWKILEAICEKDNAKAERLAREHAQARVRDRLFQEKQSKKQ